MTPYFPTHCFIAPVAFLGVLDSSKFTFYSYSIIILWQTQYKKMENHLETYHIPIILRLRGGITFILICIFPNHYVYFQ